MQSQQQAPGGRNQKAGWQSEGEALWTMDNARDRDDEISDPARKHDIQGRTRTRMVLWEEHLKSPVAALAKALDRLEAVYKC